MSETAQTLEQRFGNYAEQAHPESMGDDYVPPKSPEQNAPVEPSAPAEPQAIEPAEPQVAEPTEAPVRFEFDSLDELAKQLDVPLDAILALKAETEVDGVKGQYTLADIRKGYQLDQHNQNKSKQLSADIEKYAAMQKQYQGYLDANNKAVEQHKALAQYAQLMLNNEFQGVNWQQLHIQDPIGYITQRQNYTDRQTQINNFLQQVDAQSQAQLAQANERQQAQVQETIKTAMARNPEWATPDAFNKACEGIRDAFLKHGIKAEVLPVLLSDPSYLEMADAATKYWNLQSKKSEVTQQVRQAPKLVKAGTRTGTVKQSNLANFKAQLKANPKDSDVAGAAFAEWANAADKAGLL